MTSSRQIPDFQTSREDNDGEIGVDFAENDWNCPHKGANDDKHDDMSRQIFDSDNRGSGLTTGQKDKIRTIGKQQGSNKGLTSSGKRSKGESRVSASADSSGDSSGCFLSFNISI